MPCRWCHSRADSVGPAAPNVTIRISEDGEVQFKSPGQFVGYYKDEGKTAETLRRTVLSKPAMQASSTETGQLRIIDRANDVGKLKDGTLFAPKYIENKLKFFPNIKEAVAFGDKRDFVTVMLNIDLTQSGTGPSATTSSIRPIRSLPGTSGSTR